MCSDEVVVNVADLRHQKVVITAQVADDRAFPLGETTYRSAVRMDVPPTRASRKWQTSARALRGVDLGAGIQPLSDCNGFATFTG